MLLGSHGRLGRHGSFVAMGVISGLLLLFIAISVLTFRRRQKLLEGALGPTFDGLDPRSAIRRTPVVATVAPAPAAATRPSPAAPTAQLESAFPSWTRETPAHEILGLKATASAKEVEAAYRVLLKKYHPDRFASFGKGYQTRAHHVILLVQEARDRMLRQLV